jgi:EAL domain-containing protein (putative c-di-GMP-specific phosphodiesterase class I)/ActR/RegA family two-component response regulator
VINALAKSEAKLNRILVIEDELPLLDDIAIFLRSELKCEVHCACDREEAEALLQCYEYSLVITDLSLTPDRLEGLDLIAQVADMHGGPKVVAMSGWAAGREKSLALGMGADDFFEKPRPVSDLASISRRLTRSKFASFKTQVTGRLLEQLLRKGGIASVVQPIFRLDGNEHKLVAVECLTRGPVGSPFQRPDALFAYARGKRAEHILDQHCIAAALEAAAVIPSQIRLSLNAHASTLGRCVDFCGWLSAQAEKNSIDPLRLTIEIVEHSPIWNEVQFFRTLAALRDAGMRIALDDVCLGHSNFQLMVEAKPDYFKLDRYFVHGCHRDKCRRAVVASVAKLANGMDSYVIAEGIEDPEDLEVLRDLGIVFVQGFLFCRPIRFDQLWKMEESGNLCACSIEPRDEALCKLKGLGLCSPSQSPAVGDAITSNVTPIRSALSWLHRGPTGGFPV